MPQQAARDAFRRSEGDIDRTDVFGGRSPVGVEHYVMPAMPNDQPRKLISRISPIVISSTESEVPVETATPAPLIDSQITEADSQSAR
ncbi:hypothetical protein JQ612_17685 [Bradyrhizobium manausense]|uniref:hypothetical protein n=1 Tax=Bradyrhizobium manausense TaxID=989370 RepID=UPI001BAAF10C|nr:hypothetical protein [Bradyrhizobium manausense]MBR0835023.1 hypothetical protein [Bradyrhizobium manausense]